MSPDPYLEGLPRMTAGAAQVKHWPWQHKFEAIDVRHSIATYTGQVEHLKEGIGTYETTVLLRCECGKLKTKRLLGHWCLEQIKGQK